MKTLESIFSEIKEAGVITKRQIQLLKSRSNRQQKDVIDYAWLESIGDGYGIPLTEEQGEQGLKWLKKFIKLVIAGNIRIIRPAVSSLITQHITPLRYMAGKRLSITAVSGLIKLHPTYLIGRQCFN